MFSMLLPRGYRVISVDIPEYFTPQQFVQGFNSFLKKLKINQVLQLNADITLIHFLKASFCGCGLGGYLLQVFATYYPDFVTSLILCNTVFDTSCFHNHFPQKDMYFVFFYLSLLCQLLNSCYVCSVCV